MFTLETNNEVIISRKTLVSIAIAAAVIFASYFLLKKNLS